MARVKFMQSLPASRICCPGKAAGRGCHRSLQIGTPGSLPDNGFRVDGILSPARAERHSCSIEAAFGIG
jgi:hypothetical protein